MKIRTWCILFLVLVTLSVLATTILLPEWREVKEGGNLNHCESNLCFIRSGKDNYVMEHHLTNGDVVTREQLTPRYIKGPWNFVCFSAGKDTYTIGKVGEEPSCSIHGGSGSWHYSDGFPEFSDQVLASVIADVATNCALQTIRNTYGSSRCIRVRFASDSCGSRRRSSTLKARGVNCWMSHNGPEIEGYMMSKEGNAAPVDSANGNRPMEIRIDTFRPTTSTGSNIKVTVTVSTQGKKSRASLSYLIQWKGIETAPYWTSRLVTRKEE